MNNIGTLHFFCGKMAAGKSTKAIELADKTKSVLISEDEWLKQLYPDEITIFEDYIKYSARLKPILKSHVKNLLNNGISVAMDFPANTKNQRAWFKEIFIEAQSSHQLHYIEASDEQCLAQLKKRSQALPEGSTFTSEKEFHAINQYFQSPTEDEDFEVILHIQPK